MPPTRPRGSAGRRGADRAVGAAGDGRQVRGRSALPAPGRQRLHCSAPPPSLLSRAREAAPAPPDICIRAARLSPRSSRGPETRGAGGGAGPEGAEGPRGVSSPLRARAGALGASAARPTGSPAVRLRCRVPDAWTAEPSGSRERARSSEPPCPPAAAAAAPPGHPLSPHSYRSLVWWKPAESIGRVKPLQHVTAYKILKALQLPGAIFWRNVRTRSGARKCAISRRQRPHAGGAGALRAGDSGARARW
ncbi:collagen alpha-1(I) chain-like [Rhinopithecus roxellana]|uniref:collagen alpha-1(I) chain-like n=1 Tax=Rhinopithecus roxellana TaxID=61622 RepID=UPI0012371529|nr:collagen alpha-1(I) chain-like [Rhinopithecus roxellana]